jgi:hypothetical protein
MGLLGRLMKLQLRYDLGNEEEEHHPATNQPICFAPAE